MILMDMGKLDLALLVLNVTNVDKSLRGIVKEESAVSLLHDTCSPSFPMTFLQNLDNLLTSH